MGTHGKQQLKVEQMEASVQIVLINPQSQK